jgi:hypothetical protein
MSAIDRGRRIQANREMGMGRRLRSGFGVALSAAAMVLVLNASAVFAGEITGNGTLLHVDLSKWGTGLHARSVCAYSGQQDLQFYTDNSDTTLRTDPTKGDPSHAQSWGQLPKDLRDYLTSIGMNPGIACNPIKSTQGEP